MKNRLLILLTAILFTQNAVFCMPYTVKTTIIKFSLATGGVVLSSLLIFLGLTVYNNIRSNIVKELSPEEEVLKTPKTKEDAIKFFIRKNRL